MKNRRTRRSHIVPEFYLRGFAEPSSRIWVADLQARKLYCAHTTKVAVDCNYYAGTGAEHEDDLEQRLCSIEAAAAPSVAEFAKGGLSINPPLSRFIAWLAARTAWTRRATEEPLAEFLRQNAGALSTISGSRELPFEFEHRTSGQRQRVSLQGALVLVNNNEWQIRLSQDQFLDAVRIQAHIFASEHFPKMQWIRLKAPNGLHFVTSDRPVSWEVPGLALKDAPAALQLASVELVVPLSRCVALLAGHCLDEMLDRGIRVPELNRRVFRNAERYIYGGEADVRALVSLPEESIH